MMRLTRLPNKKRLGIVALALILPLTISSVEADKPDCPNDPTHPSCKSDGDDPGDGIKTKSANWAFWDSDYIFELYGDPAMEAKPRFCGGSDDDIDYSPHPGGWVAYVCHQQKPPSDNFVVIDLRGLSVIPSGSQPDLCERLLNMGNPYWPVVMGYPNSRPNMYYYSLDPTWNDGPCSVDNAMDTCLTKIHTSAYFENECIGKKCGRLVLMDGWGHVEAAGPRNDGLIEFNPFTKPQPIGIKELTVTFRGIGRDKVVATCFVDNWNEDSKTLIQPIYFYTFLEPQP